MSTAKSDFLALAAAANNVALTVDKVRFSTPLLNQNASIQRNTRCVLSTKKGAVPVYYDRRSLGVLFQQFQAKVFAQPGDIINAGVVAAKLAERYGLRLSADDVEASANINTTTLPVSVILTATANNFAWLGAVTVLVTTDPALAKAAS